MIRGLARRESGDTMRRLAPEPPLEGIRLLEDHLTILWYGGGGENGLFFVFQKK